LLKKALDVEKGSGNTGRENVGALSRGKLREIAQIKAKDLNAIDIEGAERIVAGTARSMGIDIEE
jgi:large subunit ribosomal protein L11